mmetsp:Transcript_32172/g.32445  ORF Transcript_32172/g.32445 Transcript_32172/m.32445 type:complete len:178 (-) Transcript_32172:754-1287(-)
MDYFIIPGVGLVGSVGCSGCLVNETKCYEMSHKKLLPSAKGNERHRTTKKHTQNCKRETFRIIFVLGDFHHTHKLCNQRRERPTKACLCLLFTRSRSLFLCWSRSQRVFQPKNTHHNHHWWFVAVTGPIPPSKTRTHGLGSFGGTGGGFGTTPPKPSNNERRSSVWGEIPQDKLGTK